MSRKRKTLFDESLDMNNLTYAQYERRLTELAISMFKWDGLPETVDERYMELTLFLNGSVVYFNDDVVGNLCLSVLPNGRLNVYGEPVDRRAYSGFNNYQKNLNENDSVIIWNNYLRTNSVLDVRMFAKRLYTYDRIMDVNVNAQKTPILIQGTTNQRLTLKNLYKEYDGNAPFIFGDKNLDINSLKVINTGAPFIAGQIYELKSKVWNEALTYLGISNLTVQKKERLLTDEVMRSQGGTVASRYSRLEARKTAAEKINRMFRTNISVDYRQDLQDDDLSMPIGGEGERMVE